MDKVLENARKEWAKLHPDNRHSIASVGWVSPDKIKYYWNGGCHAALSGAKYYVDSLPPYRELVSVFSGIQANKVPFEEEHKDIERTFMEWLLFHSPFKEGLLPDTAEGALKYRVLMGDVDKPANLMGAALMSTRLFNEHPNTLYMWWTFVKNGLHPSIAFVFSHRLYIDKNKRVIPFIPGHTGCFNGYLTSRQKAAPTSEDYLLNFLQGKVINPSVPYRKSDSESLNTFQLWAGPNKDSKGAPPIHEIDDLLARAVMGSKGPAKNPFAKAVPKQATNYPKLENALEVLIPHLSKYKEFF